VKIRFLIYALIGGGVLIAHDAPSRPVLRYHGGKFRIREWVIGHFPPHQVYVEPFGGAASVLLAKKPARIEVYNDVDAGMVSLFRILRDPEQSARLAEMLALTPFSRQEYLDCHEESVDELEEARRLIVLSFQGIGAKKRSEKNGWRTRTAKAVWSPCKTWNSYPPALANFTSRMKDVIIENLDWKRIVDIYDDPSALFFLDPPYPLATRSVGKRKIYANEMSDVGHEELLDRALSMRSKVIINSYANEMYDTKLRGWDRVTKASRAQTNAPREEVLWLNEACRQTGLFAGDK